MEKEQSGRHRYEMDPSFIDREGNLRNTSRDKKENVGSAYGFIECYASLEDLKRSLVEVSSFSPGEIIIIENLADLERVLAEGLLEGRNGGGPRELEAMITPGVNPERFKKDQQLHHIAEQAKGCERIHYTIDATSEMDNYETARGLGDAIAKSAMQHPDWYGKDGQTCSRIVYKHEGEYFDIE